MNQLEEIIVRDLKQQGHSKETILQVSQTPELGLDLKKIKKFLNLGIHKKTRTLHRRDLAVMDLELGDYTDVRLSLLERIRVWYNKNIGSGIGEGNGYNCKNCESKEMDYFKREFELIKGIPNPEKTKYYDFPVIGGAITLPEKVFYLMGRCNLCNKEQKVNINPNKLVYWD